MLKAVIGGLALGALAIWWGKRAAAGIKDGIAEARHDLGGGAHSPDGQDASRSFRAGVADENSIPDAVPSI